MMLIFLASRINPQQQKVSEYVRTESDVLKEKFD